MKNLIDSSLYFSVITEDSLMQALLLDASQAGADQALMTTPGAFHVLQQPVAESLEDTLAASRSGDDLLLAFRSQEARPVLTLEQFFANNGQLHILRQDGELIRGITALEQPQQGPLSFSTEPLGSFEQQAEAPVLATLHQAMFPIEPASFSLLAAADQPLRINNAVDALGGITGDLYSGDVTDDKFAPLQGTGPAGATLEILDGAEVIGEVKVGPDGNWTFEQESALAEGGHVFTARVKGSGETSDAFALIIDSIAPPRVVIEGIYDDREGLLKLASNAHTSDNTPFFKGTAEKLSVVEIYNGKILIGTVRANGKGEWSFAPPFTLPDGGYNITAKASDYTGNTGLASTAYKFTIDTLPPAAPTIDLVVDDVGTVQGPLQSGAVTDDTRPTLSGRAEANAVVSIHDNGKKLGEVKADANGNWSFTPEVALAEGQHSFTTRAQDAAGNLSGSSQQWEMVIDTTAPAKPGIDGEGHGISDIIDDRGPIQGPIEQGGVTDDTTPTFKGTGEVGDTIIILDKGEKIGEAVVDEQGKWTFTPDTELSDGEHTISVIIQDKAGNQSPPSDAWTIIVDTVVPTASAIVESMSKDSGASSGDFITNDGSAGRLLQGYLTAALDTGEKVQVSTDDGATWLDTLLGPNNTWVFLDKNSYTRDWTILTRVVDLAGNANVASQSVILDNVAPDAPDAFAINGSTVTITFDGSRLAAGDAILVNVGGERFEHVLTQAQINAGAVGVITTAGARMDNTSVALLDKAGNISKNLTYRSSLVDFENSAPSAKSPSASMDFGLFTFKWDNGQYSYASYPRGIIASGTQLGDGYKTSSVGLGFWGGTSSARVTLNNDETASSVTFIYADATRSGSVNFYDAQGGLIHSQDLDINSKGLSKVFSATMPAGLKFSYFEFVIPTVEHIWIDQLEFGGLGAFGFLTNDPATNQAIDGAGTYYGGDTDNVFSVSDVAYLDAANSVISGGAGTDTLTLTGADQVLDLGSIAGKLESIEIINITGTGKNTLKLSLGDVLENGGKNLFLTDENVQLMVKGDAGDKVVLGDLLNGTDLGDWAITGAVTVGGVVYNTYQHSALNAELLVQQGVAVDLGIL
ncbi:Ig-like domain-containing protein [Metapseudomonas otitidis]|uniref:Ig-like domain-containing protein n=1 Tax=Metapseudomonas otitidis TaxID=319939 RepID=UPI0013F5B1C6|nr:Ig-like domain-containing protein [Pseudomonas otitidis]